MVIANLRGSSIIRAHRHCEATREELSAPTRCRAERESCSEETVVFIIIKINKTNLLPALFKAGTRYRNRFVDKKALNFMANTGIAGGAARMFSLQVFECSSYTTRGSFYIFPPSLPPACVRVPTGPHKGDDSHVLRVFMLRGTKVFLYVEQTRFQVLDACLQR